MFWLRQATSVRPALPNISVLLDAARDGEHGLRHGAAARVGGVSRRVNTPAITAVKQANAAAAARGIPNARFEVAEVYALPFAAESFDCAFANGALMHLSEPRRALAEMRALLARWFAVRLEVYARFLEAQLRGYSTTVLAQGWMDEATLEAVVTELDSWARQPDAFVAATWCAALARKPAPDGHARIVKPVGRRPGVPRSAIRRPTGKP